MSRVRLLGVCATLAAVSLTAIPAAASAAPVITMSGSTSVAPLASLLARAYLKQYPGRVKFKLAQGGSDVGVADVAAGRVSIGNSSRDPKASDPGGLFFNKMIADDPVITKTRQLVDENGRLVAQSGVPSPGSSRTTASVASCRMKVKRASGIAAEL